MKKIIIFLINVIAFSAICILNLSSQTDDVLLKLTGSAFLENKSYNLLERICDEGGGRLAGSVNNEKAMKILTESLNDIGLQARLEKFSIPGWIHCEDELYMLEPIYRKLRVIALAYCDNTNPIVAEVVNAEFGLEENYEKIDAKGKIVLIAQSAPPNKEQPLRYECIDIAHKNGALAVLFINDKNGMLIQAGVSNFQGKPCPIPAFSITNEEGLWLKRLLNRDIPVILKIITKSYCKEIETANIIATIPGKVSAKIIVGAHFDSWDMGQGGIDNGQGTAIIFDMARVLSKFSLNNYYTIEFVWFNAEEIGIWGSKKYVEMHKKDSIIAMLNMDMPGIPTGINVMGYDDYIPFCNEFVEKMNGFNLKAGVVSNPWTNSDHIPFMFEGIASFTFSGFLEKEMWWYYHDAGDTFDKVNISFLSNAVAIGSAFIYELSNNTDLIFIRQSKEETIELFKKAGLDKRLKRQKEWIFDE